MVVIKNNIINNTYTHTLYCNNILYRNYILKKYDNCIVNDVNHIPKGKRGLILYGLLVINNKKGRPTLYNNQEERNTKRKEQKLNWYHHQRIQYNKDINKELTTTLTNKEYSTILSNFYSNHYEFNYFITLTYNNTAKLFNKESIKTDNDYKEYIKQDYVQQQRNITLEQFKKLVYKYLDSLKRDNKLVYDNYFLTFERNINQQWHCHIAINIPLPYSDSNKYWYNYLSTKWYYGISKIKVIKSRNHEENKIKVLEYITKDITMNNHQFIEWDSNIDKNSNRLVNQYDLVDNLNYSLSTYTNPITQSKLQQYGIRNERTY